MNKRLVILLITLLAVTFTVGALATETAAKDFTKVLIGPIRNVVYWEDEYKPTPDVYDEQTKLTKDTDYTIEYKDNKDVGTATVTFKGKGAYEGTVTKT